MPYHVEFTKRAARALRSLPTPIQTRIFSAIIALKVTPRPPGCKALADLHGQYRIRIGDYRIIYEIHDRELLIVVVLLGHRREIYKGL